jgi:hypothetical protein
LRWVENYHSSTRAPLPRARYFWHLRPFNAEAERRGDAEINLILSKKGNCKVAFAIALEESVPARYGFEATFATLAYPDGSDDKSKKNVSRLTSEKTKVIQKFSGISESRSMI